MDIGLIGGIVGITVGLIGAVVGTRASVRATKGPEERRFIVRASIVMWIAVLIFLGVLFLLPSPIRYFAWVPYLLGLPFGLRYMNKRQQEIREREGSSRGYPSN